VLRRGRLRYLEGESLASLVRRAKLSGVTVSPALAAHSLRAEHGDKQLHLDDLAGQQVDDASLDAGV